MARATILSHREAECCQTRRPTICYTPESSRNPYPWPRLENDDNFKGKLHYWRQKGVEPALQTWQYQTQDPWNRVNRIHTLSSYRHEVCRGEPEAPRDSLDFILKSVYHHHKEFLKSKAETLIQRETLNKPHNRLHRNRVFWVPLPEPELGHPLRVTTWYRKEDPSSIKNTIRGPHAQLTNPGYSRKGEDGSVFFS